MTFLVYLRGSGGVGWSITEQKRLLTRRGQKKKVTSDKEVSQRMWQINTQGAESTPQHSIVLGGLCSEAIKPSFYGWILGLLCHSNAP